MNGCLFPLRMDVCILLPEDFALLEQPYGVAVAALGHEGEEVGQSIIRGVPTHIRHLTSSHRSYTLLANYLNKGLSVFRPYFIRFMSVSETDNIRMKFG